MTSQRQATPLTSTGSDRRALLRRVAGTGTAALAVSALGGCVASPSPGGPRQPGNGSPLTTADLLGKTLRVYHSGDPLTQDLRQDRANIELGPDDRIVAVWIG